MKLHEIIFEANENNSFLLNLLQMNRKSINIAYQDSKLSLELIRVNFYKPNINQLKILAKLKLDSFENKIEEFHTISKNGMFDLTDAGLIKYLQTTISWLNDIRKIRRKLQV